MFQTAQKTYRFANLAFFLASDSANYITGDAINIDGGSSPNEAASALLGIDTTAFKFAPCTLEMF